MRHYYVPNTKRELIDWINRFYCTKDPKLTKMAKKQLYAIFYAIREREVKK